MAKTYSHIKIRLASPEEIRGWSHGEVKKHETINYRSLKPEPDGLFCEKIFGPTKDYQCGCGKARRNQDKGTICEKCGVEITEAKVRRERMGHIELAAPVVHTWYLKSSPSKLALLLDIKAKDLENIVYLASYIVVDKGECNEVSYRQILSEADYNRLWQNPKFHNKFKALTGAEAVKELLKQIDLEKKVVKLRKKLKTASKQMRDRIVKKLEVVESFYYSDNKPEWMVLDVLPVIPPDLRPMVQLDGGRFATTDLNDLYRRILNRNNRLKKLYEQNSPSLIIKNEKRLLQEAVDALIDNSKRGKRGAAERQRHLKSLSDILRGKQGRFRQNLLGKRVDYSGRSVIVVGPDLKMYQCGIPKEMALTLFKPFVIKELMNGDTAVPISNAKRMVDRLDDKVWGVLEEVIREHPVLLNRAPTLHRLGIQAFEPKLIEGKAIRLHPLVCTAFNADFDGDQMAVHVPLSQEAQAEARLLMLASNNILNPKDGKPVVTPSQDMVLGNYYLTMERPYMPYTNPDGTPIDSKKSEYQLYNGIDKKDKKKLDADPDGGKYISGGIILREYPKNFNEGHVYLDFDEAVRAYKNNEITLQTRIALMPSVLNKDFSLLEEKEGIDINKVFIITTLGKMIFNKILPEGFPYLNEPTVDNLTKYTPKKFFVSRTTNIPELLRSTPVSKPFPKKFLEKIIAEVFKRFQIAETSKMLDNLKDLGFKYSTTAGITISATDVNVYSKKQEVIKEAEANCDRINAMLDFGELTLSEKKKLVQETWNDALKKIKDGLESEFDIDNHIFMMQDSGARGSISNFAQLAGMRGLMNDPTGGIIEVPVKANFFEGITVPEFFISTHGARKGSTDTALKTAESGYLTRRLVDVSQDVIVSERDCHTDKGAWVSEFKSTDGKEIESLFDRIVGRFAAKSVIDPKTGEVLVNKNELINNDIADRIVKSGITKVCIRNVLNCNCERGVCIKCYGRNLATNLVVEVGEAVGVIAAQSIGEPGTQLTMRTFHTGGVASAADITQGLPRVQELFEARTPKGKAIISEISGTVKAINSRGNMKDVIIENADTKKIYSFDEHVQLAVNEGDSIERGQMIKEGSIAPKELLRVTDAETTQQYIIKEVQTVYRAQGVDISDKHVEIIVKQMMKRISIISEGDTQFLPGSDVSIQEFLAESRRMAKEKGKMPVGKILINGITRAALKSTSWLSAASFQETTRVLTDACIKGKKDSLAGLKENIIIGGQIPAGTGILTPVEGTYKYPVSATEENNDELNAE